MRTSLEFLRRGISHATKYFSSAKEPLANALDPKREDRIRHLVNVMKHDLKTGGQKFSLAKTLAGLEYTPKDLATAKKRVYSSLLQKSWQDEVLTLQEQETAQWVAACIELSPGDRVHLNFEFARETFAQVLDRAIEKGVLDASEEARLHGIATSSGRTLSQFSSVFFRLKCQGLVRNIIIARTRGNHLTQEDWSTILHTGKVLGMETSAVCEAVAHEARAFVERLIADAKAQERLSREKEENLRWMLANLGFTLSFQAGMKAELSTLRSLTDIKDGVLPSLTPPQGFQRRAGEIVHFQADAFWSQVRQVKGVQEPEMGRLFLTDRRLIFLSSMRSITINYARIILLRESSYGLEVQAEGKPVHIYRIDEAHVAYLILQTVLDSANQARSGGQGSRRIPEDVKRAVWRRDGGKCVECGSKEKLEYDHIIPFSEGGSNTKRNVQLLCETCNRNKSNKIG